MVKSLALKTKLENAEKIKKILFSEKKYLIQENLSIKKDEKFIYFPVKEEISDLKDCTFIPIDFDIKNNQPKSYKEIVELPDEIADFLPTSFDVIGEIALLKLPNELLNFKEVIGNAILKTNKNIKTVCNIQPVSGEYRIRDIKILAGEEKTKTVHKEYGVKFSIDITKTYFSPRLANERKIIADQVKDNETIIDMFTGVAPFPVIIAKYAKPKIIYGFDNNKYAIRYAKENITQNNVLDKVEVFCEDAKNISKKFGDINADRIIMNLPFSSYEFFPESLSLISNNAVINYYEFLNEEKINQRIDDLKRIAKNRNIELLDFNVRKIKTYAPHEFYIGIDITAKKNK